MKLEKINIEGLASGTCNCNTIGKETVCVPRLEINDKITGLLFVNICDRIEFSVVKRNNKQ